MSDKLHHEIRKEFQLGRTFFFNEAIVEIIITIVNGRNGKL